MNLAHAKIIGLFANEINDLNWKIFIIIVEIQVYCSFISLNLLTALLTVAAAVVLKTKAPPATVF